MISNETLGATSANPLLEKRMQESLCKHFGFTKFLDTQAQVIESILEGRDALIVMPTGGGKSLCYQLPALMRDGLTIVVSPLIALMKDQVAALEKRQIPATFINSTLSLEEQKKRMQQMAEGSFKLIYVAPERFRSHGFLANLRQTKITLFAVDEAHCLSQWGHDFRPDYFRLGEVIEMLGRPQIAAFTATATPEVRLDIREHLRLRDPSEFVAGFARPNLSLFVRHVGNEAEKHDRLAQLIKDHQKGIVYCATRKRVEQIANLMKQWKVRYVAYHAGLSDGDREAAQEAFISKAADVVIATNAFGMGIDRGDIRFVVHYEIPGSLEAYYQEIGRAGRDGKPAVCELFYLSSDTRIQEFFLDGANPSLPFIQSLWRFLGEQGDDNGNVLWTSREIADRLDSAGGEMAVGSALAILDRSDCIRRLDIPGSRRRIIHLLERDLSAAALPIDVEALNRKAARDWTKWRRMTAFTVSGKCRQQSILEYFGEAKPSTCGCCDNCVDSQSLPQRPPSEEESIVIRKILSGVARMSYRRHDAWQGRFGKTKIIHVLQGRRSRTLIEAGLHTLSTYGILKECDTTYLQMLFRELEFAGFLITSEGRYAILTLTASGAEVMRGKKDYTMRWHAVETPEALPKVPVEKHAKRSRPQPRRTKKISHNEEMDVSQWKRFERLRTQRAQIAKAEGIAPFRVFSDQVLCAFARLRPLSVEAALRIRGVGEVKASQYFPKFLSILKK